MFGLLRVRLAITDDGGVLAILGAEMEGPGGLPVEMRREGATEEEWRGARWLRPDDLS